MRASLFALSLLTVPVRVLAASSAIERFMWWESLPNSTQCKLVGLFDKTWFKQQDTDTQTTYTELASSIFNFSTVVDAHPDDDYLSFAPILLRTSFHSSGTYSDDSGTGGANGGTIFNHAELSDSQNGCIEIATSKLEELFQEHDVPLADAVVIAGVVALDVMEVRSTQICFAHSQKSSNSSPAWIWYGYQVVVPRYLTLLLSIVCRPLTMTRWSTS